MTETGQFLRKCSKCGKDQFKLQAVGKLHCASCEHQYKGLPGFSSDELDELYIAVQDRQLFFNERLEEEVEPEARMALTCRAKGLKSLAERLLKASNKQIDRFVAEKEDAYF